FLPICQLRYGLRGKFAKGRCSPPTSGVRVVAILGRSFGTGSFSSFPIRKNTQCRRSRSWVAISSEPTRDARFSTSSDTHAIVFCRRPSIAAYSSKVGKFISTPTRRAVNNHDANDACCVPCNTDRDRRRVIKGGHAINRQFRRAKSSTTRFT